jgi:hypothetical protein
MTDRDSQSPGESGAGPSADAEARAVAALLADVVERTHEDVAADVRRWLEHLLTSVNESERILAAELERAFPL